MNEESKPPQAASRHLLFLSLLLLSVIVFRRSLSVIFGSALWVDQYSHILLVLPVSALLLYLAREKMLARVSYSWVGGAAFVLLAAGFAYTSMHRGAFSPSSYLSLSILFFVTWTLAAFLLCYGTAAFRTVAFPLLFLILMVPLPDAALQRSISMLQDGSADATCLLFKAAHIPYARHGIVVELPKIDIEIAEECSGIRSSLILLLSGLVLGHLFLNSGWSKALLVAAVFPITVAKNGLRIFVLSTLGMYVDPSFLRGTLHRDGGIVFFALGFGALLLLIWLLQKFRIEQKAAVHSSPEEVHQRC